MAPLRILVVENETFVAEDIRHILEDAGHTVVGIAKTVGDALKLARKSKPQLAFLDVDLGNGESGLDAADQLAKDFGVPGVFLTDCADFRVRAMALDIQPIGFVTKPYRPEDIVEAASLTG